MCLIFSAPPSVAKKVRLELPRGVRPRERAGARGHGSTFEDEMAQQGGDGGGSGGSGGGGGGGAGSLADLALTSLRSNSPRSRSPRTSSPLLDKVVEVHEAELGSAITNA